jgi:hypothetical protein
MSSAFAPLGRQNVIAESASIALNSDVFGTKPDRLTFLMVSSHFLLLDGNVVFERFLSNAY